MPDDPDRQANMTHEIAALRRRVRRLEGVEQRCREAEAALDAFERRNRLLGDSTPLGIFTIDIQGQITGINRRMQEFFDWMAVDTSQVANLFECRVAAVSSMVADIQRCIGQQEPVISDHHCKSHHGEVGHLRANFSPVFADEGGVSSVMAVVEDITDLKRTEAALRESEKRYRQLFQSAPIALIEWDVSHLKAYLKELRASGITDFSTYLEENPRQVHHCWALIKTVDYNQAFLELMGIADSPGTEAAFLPTDSSVFVKMAREVILVAAAGKTAEERETTLVTTSGAAKIVLGRSLPVSGHENTLQRVAIAMVDITQRKRAEEALRESERRFREQALRDSLTGLYNQRYLYQSLGRWMAPDASTATPISMIFMDLDHFKQVVDTHGHLNGSRAIQKVAQTIDSCLQEPAFAVAYAGDEFVVVLPGVDQPQALEKAYEIRNQMRATVYRLDQNVEVRLQASFGVATFPHHATDISGLIAAADQALFAVKGTGKGAVGQFPPAG